MTHGAYVAILVVWAFFYVNFLALWTFWILIHVGKGQALLAGTN